MNKKLFPLGLLIVSTQFNTYAIDKIKPGTFYLGKTAAQDEQPEASSSQQHPSGFFGFDAHTIPSSFEPVFQTHLSNTEEASSSHAIHPNLQNIDYIAEHFDELMASAKILENDCEAAILIKRSIKKELHDLKPIIETKKMLALCREMQKKQKEEQAAKATQSQDSKQEEASSSHEIPF